MKIPKNIILSRTDSIGDMVLSLPVATVLKQNFPDMTIAMMGTGYTKAIVETNPHIDCFIDKEDFLTQTVTINGQAPQAIIHLLPQSQLARRAKELAIPLRIGTTNRLYHWLNCNKLVPLSRRKSGLHEAQLNLQLLKPFGINTQFSMPDITDLFYMNNIPVLTNYQANLLHKNKFKLIFHPKSRGSAREWDMAYYVELINSLDSNKFQIFISGTTSEQPQLQYLLNEVGSRVTDISGLMSLSEFIAFIANCDGLIACSTGPLHIAAALNKYALGIYPPMQPIHPGRWQPIGKKAQTFVLDKNCNACRKDQSICFCMQAIKPQQLKEALELIYKNEFSTEC
ncbi:MAG: glycosyltransferase family 9 protein [Methylovulum sp.]|nr:glycosyltransferase family 9 protein [Methylovulum sp.]MCF7997509.1 glycosyltransferase family 9 protein [Methylovulum sp.]MCF8006659.1 glycosyltransferase family 9 protein [Methylovulum sp.]